MRGVIRTVSLQLWERSEMLAWRLGLLSGWQDGQDQSGTHASTPYLPLWADMANQRRHSAAEPGRAAWEGALPDAPGRAFCKGRMESQGGKASCHNRQPLEVEVGLKPGSPDSRAS